MQKDIIRVLKYFHFFSYSPNFKEIHTFLNIKTSKENLHKITKALISKKKITKTGNLYTLGEYSKSKIKSQKLKVKISHKKLNNYRFRAYIKLISLFPQIKLIGISGSIAINNAKIDDDIDLFIITSQSRLWSARFLCVLIAWLLGIKRLRLENNPSSKVCLNLFFEETNLKVSKNKQNYYIAHEIVQMVPLVTKDQIYTRFLAKNIWVNIIFPNFRIKNITKVKTSSKTHYLNKIGDKLEKKLKEFQLSFINRHKTKEIITNTQLWFFPNDFEEELPSFARKKVS
ncbi:MAG: hypothetical protein ABH812_02700 [bacterium]